MLNYLKDDETLKKVAIFYAQQIHSPLAEAFFSGQVSLGNADEAGEIATAFWKMTELAANDHLQDIEVLEGIDIEFWLHKLFNKTYGYFDKNGFKPEWQLAQNKQNL